MNEKRRRSSSLEDMHVALAKLAKTTQSLAANTEKLEKKYGPATGELPVRRLTEQEITSMQDRLFDVKAEPALAALRTLGIAESDLDILFRMACTEARRHR